MKRRHNWIRGTAPTSNSWPLSLNCWEAGRWSTGKNFPSGVASVPETSKALLNLFSPVGDCRRPSHLLAGPGCSISNPGAWAPGDTQAQQPHPSEAWPEGTEDWLWCSSPIWVRSFYWILLPFTLKNTEILACHRNICSPGHCG